MMYYTLKLKKVVLPALLLAIAVVGMQLSSCKKKNNSPASTVVSLAGVVFQDTALLTKTTEQSYVAKNLPTGVDVAYTDNSGTAPGTHNATATFTLKSGFTWGTNEQAEADASGKIVRTAKLTITDYLTDGGGPNGGVVIVKATDIRENVEIPDNFTVFGEFVTSIGDGAFANNTTLKTIKIGEGVEYVGRAFWGCTNLTTVDLPSTLKNIENEAFIKAPLAFVNEIVKLSPAFTKLIIRATNPPKIQNIWQRTTASDGWYPTLIGTIGWIAKEIDPNITTGEAELMPLGVKIYLKDQATIDDYKNTTNAGEGDPRWDWTRFWNTIHWNAGFGE